MTRWPLALLLAVLGIAWVHAQETTTHGTAAQPTGLARLTYAAETHLWPVHSRSGQYIAHIERGPQGERCVIITRTGQRLASGGHAGDRIPCAPSWAPDSKRVCWVTTDGVLCTLALDGTSVRSQLQVRGSLSEVIWQPHGGRALVATSHGIFSVPIDSDSPLRRAQTLGEPGSYGAISLSADGSRLAYVSGGAVYLTPSPGSAGRPIAAPDERCSRYEGVWLSPSGLRAVVTGVQMEQPEVRCAYLVELAGLVTTSLECLGLDVSSVAWNAAAKEDKGVAFIVAAGGELLMYGWAGDFRGTVIRDAAEDIHPSISPQGDSVTFASTREPAGYPGALGAVYNLFAVAL